jgi:hypothetical protein
MRFHPVKMQHDDSNLSRKKKNITLNYTLKNTTLEFLTSIKYLGVHINNDLHWGKHIEEI